MFILTKSRNLINWLVLLVCIWAIPVFKILYFNIFSTTEIEMCPMCIGNNHCSCLRENNFILNWDYLWSNTINIIVIGRVIFGSCFRDEVVLKLLSVGSSKKKMGFTYNECSNCSNSIEVVKLIQHLTEPKFLSSPQNFILCPSTEKIELFLQPIIQKNVKGNITEQYLNLYYTMQVNVEPLIQQVVENWAVAEYIGSCGRISISRYCGNTLTWIAPQLNWTERIDIAKQLLQLALNATFDHPDFAFYFTDMSPDNFAVSSENVIRLIDLEHVIVVDKNPKDPPNAWNERHKSYHDDSISGFTFSPQDICSHQISDMNIYSICQGILSQKSDLLVGGLLNAIPKHMQSVHKLIQECISPRENQSRFDVVYSIMNVLDVRWKNNLPK